MCIRALCGLTSFQSTPIWQIKGVWTAPNPQASEGIPIQKVYVPVVPRVCKLFFFASRQVNMSRYVYRNQCVNCNIQFTNHIMYN